MRVSKIGFPGLGISPFEIDSVAFSIFGIEIAWYAVIITVGMIMAVLYCSYRAKQIGISFDDVIDFALAAIPLGIIGARLYYILTKIENFPTFRDWISIRDGGLAIYGGIIAGTLAVITVAKIKKINFLAFADCTMPGIILAQAIGRWGNFCNGEAFGYETESFLRMSLCNGLTGFQTVMVHPCFLYESLWNILGFVLVNLFYEKRKYDGQIFVAVCGWYGLGRAWIEGLRTDSLYLPKIFGIELRISQVLAIGVFLVCIGFLVYHFIKKTNKTLYIKTEKRKDA